jgi:hypothetical protein
MPYRNQEVPNFVEEPPSRDRRLPLEGVLGSIVFTITLPLILLSLWSMFEDAKKGLTNWVLYIRLVIFAAIPWTAVICLLSSYSIRETAETIFIGLLITNLITLLALFADVMDGRSGGRRDLKLKHPFVRLKKQ